MARRRRRFHRVSPERGWMLGTASRTNTYPATSSITNIFSFLEVDGDPPDVAGDKSDWFIKRFIFDAYASYGPASGGVNPTDTARLWTMGLGVMASASAVAWDNLNAEVFDPTYVENSKRVFGQWAAPVYATWAAQVNGTDFILNVDTTPTAPTYSVVDSPWGPARITGDITVSNAGLRDDDAVYMALSQAPGPGTFDWDAGDVLNVVLFYKVLLQKRR